MRQTIDISHLFSCRYHFTVSFFHLAARTGLFKQRRRTGGRRWGATAIRTVPAGMRALSVPVCGGGEASAGNPTATSGKCGSRAAMKASDSISGPDDRSAGWCRPT
jgi:hypothetical protein